MKRRPYGVNLDDGIALATVDEFRLLFVDARPDIRQYLRTWLIDKEAESLLFGGQIGSGKTTLLNEVILSSTDASVIRMRFDTDCIDATDGGYALLVLGHLLRVCRDKDVGVDGCGMEISDFAGLGCADWKAVVETLINPPSSLLAANRLREFAGQVTPNAGHVRRSCGELLDRLSRQTDSVPVLIADGVDKFALQTSDYESLRQTLAFLARYKTLFEVNAVHLFRDTDFRPGIRKLCVTGIADDSLYAIFGKRLGAYASMYEQAFPLLCAYSGGNARQALRLLNAYYYQRTQRRESHEASLAQACHRVSSDLLSLPFAQFPADVAHVVKRDGYIEGSILEQARSQSGAVEAVYRNWFLLNSTPHQEEPTRWPARLNPLIDMAIDWVPVVPLSAEQELVRKWAREHDVSPLGLNVPLDSSGEPDWVEFWTEIESSSSSRNDGLSILRLLEEIGAGLFGVERQDRIVVAYQCRDNLESVRDFLVGKANTYGFFPCREIVLVGGEGRQPIQALLVGLALSDPSIIYSVEIQGAWTDSQLRDLEHRRDMFDNLQMLWWIQQDDLERYKPYWPQLRQLFRFYRLEEELWRGITPKEIEADIAMVRELSANTDPEGVHRLQSVLEYLRASGGAT